jgi:hypothetical protein
MTFEIAVRFKCLQSCEAIQGWDFVSRLYTSKLQRLQSSQTVQGRKWLPTVAHSERLESFESVKGRNCLQQLAVVQLELLQSGEVVERWKFA